MCIRLRVLSQLILFSGFIFHTHCKRMLYIADELAIGFVDNCQLIMCRPYNFHKSIEITEINTVYQLINMEEILRKTVTHLESSNNLSNLNCLMTNTEELGKPIWFSESWRAQFVIASVGLRMKLTIALRDICLNYFVSSKLYTVLLAGLVSVLCVFRESIVLSGVTINLKHVLIADLILRSVFLIYRLTMLIAGCIHIRKWKRNLLKLSLKRSDIRRWCRILNFYCDPAFIGQKDTSVIFVYVMGLSIFALDWLVNNYQQFSLFNI